MNLNRKPLGLAAAYPSTTLHLCGEMKVTSFSRARSATSLRDTVPTRAFAPLSSALAANPADLMIAFVLSSRLLTRTISLAVEPLTKEALGVLPDL